MAGKSRYTESDKGRVYATLVANDFNVKRTARETQTPENTVRRWRDQWKANGPPMGEDVKNEIGILLGDLERIHNKILVLIEGRIDDGQGNLKELGTLFGIINDKLTRARGMDRTAVDHFHHLPAAEEIREALSGIREQAIEMAAQRDSDIIDAELVEETKALPR